MNENMKRQIILSEREKKAIIFNWDIFRMPPLPQPPPPPNPTPHPSKILHDTQNVTNLH